MVYYKLIVSYKGTRFYGWQRQKGNCPTVQSHLEKCLLKIYGGQESKTLASGRTDAGVHALAQVVRLIAPWDIHCRDLKNALNSLLAPDVRIQEVSPSGPSFHPIRDAVGKEYCYLFSTTGREKHPFFHEMIANIGRDADRERMEQAARVFEGRHDFCNYCTRGGNVASTWKRIDESRIEPVEVLFPLVVAPPSLCVYRVRGEGFMKQMVRLMMGAIIAVGRGRASVEDIQRSLRGPLKDKVGAVVSPRGLYLKEVFYEKS